MFIEKSIFGLNNVALKSKDITVASGASAGTLALGGNSDVLAVIPKTNGAVVKSVALNRVTFTVTLTLTQVASGDSVYEVIYI